MYWLVATAQGAIVSWNAGNILCSFLAARAFLETYAVLHKVRRELFEAVGAGDLKAIDGLSWKKMMFSTRDKKVLDSRPEFLAPNVCTLIDHLGKEFKVARKAYDAMSERCHPNSLGTFLMFAEVGEEKVAYSDRHKARQAFFLIFPIVGLVTAAEPLIARIDEIIDEISTLECQP
ncbi:MAG TPA: hypothetical protein VHP35_01935 [Terriglobia bacterium]|nr:hypothetical protein [Terriglobia bacterium]